MNVAFLFLLILFSGNTISLDIREDFKLYQKKSDISDEVGDTLLGTLDPKAKSDLFARPNQGPSAPGGIGLGGVNKNLNVFDTVKRAEAKKEEEQKNAALSNLQNIDNKKNNTNNISKSNATVVPPTPPPVPAINKTKTEKKKTIKKAAKASPPPVIKKKSSKLGNKTQSDQVCLNHLHVPYTAKDNKNLNSTTALIIIIFGTIFLTTKYLFSLRKKISDQFLIKMHKVLSQQMLMYFILVGIFVILYTLSYLDSYRINWQFLLAGFCVFGLFWYLFCFLLIIVCTFIVMNWRVVEKNSENLKALKDAYDNKANEEYSSGRNKPIKETSAVFELYEYNILKTYFVNPFFPTFKPSNLRKDFNFSLYLEYCLGDKLRLFVKISWTCWIFAIFLMFIWSIFITTSKPIVSIYLSLFLPLFGLLLSLGILIYLKRIYRGVVIEINKINYMNFIDVSPSEGVGNARNKIIDMPLYLFQVLKANSDQKDDNINVSKFNFNLLFHNKPPSIYDDLMILGTTGFFFLINAIQMIGFMFILWTILHFFKKLNYMIESEGNWIVFMFILLIFVYFVVYLYLLSQNLKWYTIISSIEMRRSESNIKKVVQNQLQKSSFLAERFYANVKKIYFDVRISEVNSGKVNEVLPMDKELGISKTSLLILLNIQLSRFKNIPKRQKTEGSDFLIKPDFQDFPLNIELEFKTFLKSCGNNLSNEEIEDLLHFIEKIDDKEFKEITYKDIRDLYIMNVFFSNHFPQKIINYVFERVFPEEGMIEASKIVDFMIETKYFSQEEINFIRTECTFLEKEFSIDTFAHMITSLRKYHPY